MSHLYHLPRRRFTWTSLTLLCVGCASGPTSDGSSGLDLVADANTTVIAKPDTPVVAGGLDSNIALTGPNVYSIGRVDASSPNVLLLGWPGTQIVGGFTGTSIAAKLRDGVGASSVGNNGNNYFDVAVDNGDAFVIKLDQNVTLYPLANNLADANHVVRLTKRTESKIGIVAFDGFVLDANREAIATPTPLTRRIEFLGDSGAAGYGADGLMPCVFSAATENASQSYPLITARRLDAIVNDVAYSGKGLYQNKDIVNDANKTLPVLWRRIFPDVLPVKSWDSAKYIPDAMVMVLSGNDFSASIPEMDPFIAKVKPFIVEVRTAYPSTPLFIMISPLLQFPNRTTATTLAKGLIDAVGDRNFSFIEVAPETGTHGWGCDKHLTGAAAEAVADQLVVVLQKALGW
jgi:hypothetical protein